MVCLGAWLVASVGHSMAGVLITWQVTWCHGMAAVPGF